MYSLLTNCEPAKQANNKHQNSMYFRAFENYISLSSCHQSSKFLMRALLNKDLCIHILTLPMNGSRAFPKKKAYSIQMMLQAFISYTTGREYRRE